MSDPMNPEKEQRVLQLVQELVGAQAVAKILQETWDSLRPEMKTELAQALGQAALERIRSNERDSFNDPLRDIEASITETLLKDTQLQAELIAAVREKFETRRAKLVEDIVERVSRVTREATLAAMEKALNAAVWEMKR